MNLFPHFAYLQTKLQFLVSDYVGFNIDLYPFANSLINFILAAIYLLIAYLIGRKLKKIITKDKFLNFDIFLHISLGYIFIASGIFLLGFFSLLYKEIVIVYTFIIVIISIFPLSDFKYAIKDLSYNLLNSLTLIKSNYIVFIGVSLFVFIAGLNLLNPEVREDQYHVDFPRIFLREHTTMIPPKEDLHVSGSSMLSEMFYLPAIAVSKESARYIHFLFYLLVLLLLASFSKLKRMKFAIYTPLIFATSPEIIRETSTMYTDFQWIFLLLLSVAILLTNNKNQNKFILIGILLGGMISTKLWTIVLIPLITGFAVYLNKSRSFKIITNTILNLIIGISLVSSFWFLRAYLLTGNPLFPAFHTFENIDGTTYTFNFLRYFTLNTNLIDPLNTFNVYSPIFFLGIILIILNLKKIGKNILQNNFFLLPLIVFISYLLLNYPYGRYMLGAYVTFIFLASLGIFHSLETHKRLKNITLLMTLALFLYYFVSSLLVLPYTLGISNKNSYLSRILIRDNSSYYNFEYKFDNHIKKDEKVAMYNFHGYYYADFNFIDVNYIINRNNQYLESLKRNGTTKLLIRGGNIEWFCNKLRLKNCEASKYSLISEYKKHPYYYLYKLN